MNDDDDAVEALMTATRVLVGVATGAMEELGGVVTLPGFRLLLALDELGPSPGNVAAARLGTAASSVTRLGDSLEASGHLTRRRDPANRSVVLLEPTPRGTEVVHGVLRRRREALRTVVTRVPTNERPALTSALHTLRDAAGSDFGAGPLELTAL
ncbi:MarR family transcriptional regulator [Actinomycetospora endophytica]|uniref:MarR family transcriptional regulator n=1 Tax=Actinomycetospora endophytica TaxID=2291215 RepID=A0ABS8PHM2_9PSEU|nr:MarR family transcriptional regulator [Actinomycetospora endophytica]MCD2197740.1 MarR family transcriptional regulator [Actinomycetospora endophytica]